MDWMVLNGDKLVVGTEEVGEDEEDEVEEEEVKSKLDMRGEGPSNPYEIYPQCPNNTN
jgi:hypothetical protein